MLMERLSSSRDRLQAMSAAKKRRSSWAPATMGYEAALGAEQLTEYARQLGAGAASSGENRMQLWAWESE
jgi:hypothetical protein